MLRNLRDFNFVPSGKSYHRNDKPTITPPTFWWSPIASDAGIRVYAIKGSWRLDETIQSKIIAMAFSMAAEIERDLISARTKEALRARKASGLPLGRPKGPGKSKLDPFRPEIEALLANGSTQRFIAKRYNTTPGNFANWMKKNGIKKPKA